LKNKVVAGGVDDGSVPPGLHGEVVQVGVVAGRDGGDELGLGLTGVHVSCEDFLADMQLADRHQPTRSGQHVSAGGEALPTAEHAGLRDLADVARGGGG
jgi:hypothetical protein